ncbi:MAG: hypothetical protein ABJP04_06080 [Hyphomicrobiales bacterium]
MRIAVISTALLLGLGACTAVNKDLGYAVDAEPYKYSHQGKSYLYYINHVPANRVVWVQNPTAGMLLASVDTRPQSWAIRVAQAQFPEGCKFEFITQVQPASYEVFYTC